MPQPRSHGAYRDATIAGGGLRPFVRGIGNAVEAAVTAPKGKRLGAALRGAGDVKGFRGAFTGPRLARDVVEGGLGGAAINAGREGLELGRAKRTARDFLHSDKMASVMSNAVNTVRSVGKKQILMDAGEVWGHNTHALRSARAAAGHADDLGNAKTMIMPHAGAADIGNARTLMRCRTDRRSTRRPPVVPHAAAPVAARSGPGRRSSRPPRGGRCKPGVASVARPGFASRCTGRSGVLAVGGPPACGSQQRTAKARRGAAPQHHQLGQRIQPVPTSKRRPS